MSSSQQPRFAVPLLAGLLFVFLTVEIYPVGALPELSAGLHASEGQVGLLVSGYAIIAAALALPMAHLVRRLDRRTVLVGSALLLAVSQFLLAAADNLPTAILARSASAATHAVVWGGAPVVAARLAAPGQAGKATASVFVGTSLGMVLGGPLSAAVSQVVGWRVAAVVLGALAALIAVALHRRLPSVPALPPRGTGRATGGDGLTGVYVATVVLVVAHFVSYPYLALLAGRVGVSGTEFTVLLALYGISGLLALRPLGPLLDRSPRAAAAMMLTLLLLGLVCVAVGVTAGVWVGSVLWAAGSCCLPVVLQTAVIRRADDPDQASAAYVAVYQVGIAAGSAAGAGLLARVDVEALPVVSAGIVALAATTLIARRSLD